MPQNKLPQSRIVVASYDTRWPSEFEWAAGEIVAAIGSNLLALHHIGSTSIPGMYAKPVIDMLAVANDLSGIDQGVAKLEQLGYEAMGEFGIVGRRYFRRDDDVGRRTHQIHAFAARSPHIRRHVLFRDFMRAHPQSAKQYGQLKLKLAADHPFDMGAYMDGKDSFIEDMESRALQWAASQDHDSADGSKEAEPSA